MAMDNDEEAMNVALPRIIQTPNTPDINGQIMTTLVTLRFKQPRNGAAINIPQKHKELLKILKTIDDTLAFIENSLIVMTQLIPQVKTCLLERITVRYSTLILAIVKRATFMLHAK